MRLALSGSAGTGKTTLAQALADKLGLPYLEEGMRKRLAAGLDLRVLDVQGLRDLMIELWEEQADQERLNVSGFVADRSSLDYAAFWMHYSLYEDVAQSDAFMARTQEHAKSYDRVILLPWDVIHLEDDGVRTTNRWLQLRYQGILEGCLSRFLSPDKLMKLPETDDFERRLQLVLAGLQ